MAVSDLRIELHNVLKGLGARSGPIDYFNFRIAELEAKAALLRRAKEECRAQHPAAFVQWFIANVLDQE